MTFFSLYNRRTTILRSAASAIKNSRTADCRKAGWYHYLLCKIAKIQHHQESGSKSSQLSPTKKTRSAPKWEPSCCGSYTVRVLPGSAGATGNNGSPYGAEEALRSSMTMGNGSTLRTQQSNPPHTDKDEKTYQGPQGGRHARPGTVRPVTRVQPC